MNYSALLKRGLSYANNAGDNWHRRKIQLIQAWDESTGARRQRLFTLAARLDDLVTCLGRHIVRAKEAARQQAEEASRMTVLLSCRNIDCPDSPFNPTGILIGMPYAHYAAGPQTCEKCGGELVPDGEDEREDMLWGLGITAPR